MAKFRPLLTGVAMLVTSAGVALGPAGAAHAVEDFTALNRCTAATTPQASGGVSPPANSITSFNPSQFIINNDAFKITASGTITIDHWGARKSVNGDPELAGPGWPLPGARKYMLIAMVDKGWMVTPGGTVLMGRRWFPVGSDSGCLRYVRRTPVSPADPSATLTFAYNDDALFDNSGAANVVVRQWFCVVCSTD